MNSFPAANLSAGFVHNGNIVYALNYDLVAELGHFRHLIVWLTTEGDASAPWITPAEAGRRIVTTKPGEFIRFRGELEKVTGVSVWRSSQLPGALESGR